MESDMPIELVAARLWSGTKWHYPNIERMIEENKRLRAELATRTVELARMTSERDTERRTAEDRGRSLIEMAHLSSIRTEDAATEAQPVSNTDELASIPLKAWVIEVFQHLCHSPHTPRFVEARPQSEDHGAPQRHRAGEGGEAVNFLVGLNGDNWPTAIPLDRVSSIRVDPEDMAATLEFLDDTRSETLTKAVLCNESETMWMLRALATIAKDDAEKASNQ